MAGKHHYNVLTQSFDRNSLIERGKHNGVLWDEHENEGVNWLRFSHALTQHLDANKPFYMDDVDTPTLQKMHNHYSELKNLHIKTMVPHVRSALQYLQSNDPESSHKHHTEYLPHVYEHLDANGGHHWAEKVRTLGHINGRLKYLSERLKAKGIDVNK